jgi:hypothetical protein
LPGWELTAANTGLNAIGRSCDSLPVYTGGSKPAAGTTISGKLIETGLDLSAGDILVERSCIRPKNLGITQPLVTTTGECTGDSCAVTPGKVTIRDSDFDGSKLSAKTIAGSCAFLGVGVLQRNRMHGMGSGICFYNTGKRLDAIAEGNYIHQLRSDGDSHNDGATIRDFVTTSTPGRRAVFRGNRIDCSSGNDTGALFIQTLGADIDQVTIEQNLLEGGGYQLGLEAGFGHVYGKHMRAVNNRFSGTGWGARYVERKSLSYGWSEWQDNHINDPAKTGHKGRAVTAP